MDSEAVNQDTLSYRKSPLVFTGKAAEYFKIWIVNTFLSIITLGIYSAWAKVRNTQYLYGHTKVEGHSLRYLAKPMQILKGRIIAFVFFALYMVSSSINPMLSLIFMVVLVIATPWLIIQGLKFTLQHTSYRNIRFSFKGSYWGAFVHFFLLPVLGAITAYLAMPWVMKRMDQYIRDNVTYGDKPFDLETSTGTYYAAALSALGVAIIFIVVGFALVTAGAALAPAAEMTAGTQGFPPVFGILIILYYFVAIALVTAIYKAVIRNHILNNLTIENIAAFKSRIKILPYAWIMVSNAVLIVLTVGLAFPVTVIRMNRYLASVTDVLLTEEADNMVDNLSVDPSALGEEAAGLFDMDLSLT